MSFINKQLPAIALLFFANIICAQKTKEEIDTAVSIHSSILNEEVTLNISLPKGYNKGKAGYPVVYVLDVRHNFSFTVEAAQILYNNSRRVKRYFF